MAIRRTKISPCQVHLQKIKSDESDPSPLHDPHSICPSPSKGPITQSMIGRIQEGLEQQEPNMFHGLHMLFSWVK